MSLRSTIYAAPRLLVALAASVFVLAGATAPAICETSAATITDDGAGPMAVVDGFRSARFGMDEAAVRAAILEDFGVEQDQVLASENAVERTQILTVAVPDLIADGGIAQVSYVFGYTSKTLIQVGATWSAKTDATLTAKMLYDNGDVLRSHFMAVSYMPESVKTNVALPNGILMFRGADADGRATLLLLQGTYSTEDDGRKTLIPVSLDLLYSSDPNEPDIFVLPEGAF